MIAIAQFRKQCHPEAIRQRWLKDLSASIAGSVSMYAGSCVDCFLLALTKVGKRPPLPAPL